MNMLDGMWKHVQRCEHGEICPECCWLWSGRRDRHGYGKWAGRIAGKERTSGAHRLSWSLTNGAIPAGMHVLHNCPGRDNPSCVNPSHLWLGTPKDNMQDAREKRQLATGKPHWQEPLQGIDNPMARLKEEQVLDIRYLAAHGMPHRLLGAIYGVDRSAVGKITRGENWKHLPLIVEER